jgi:hypothetical protein
MHANLNMGKINEFKLPNAENKKSMHIYMYMHMRETRNKFGMRRISH